MKLDVMLTPTRRRLGAFVSSLLSLGFALAVTASAQTDQTIYDDSLGAGWQNWSWASVDLASTASVHSGSTAIAVTAGGWSALSLQHDAFSTAGYGNLNFWINGGPTGGQVLRVIATLDHSGLSTAVTIGPLAANTWQKISVPLASLAADNVSNFTGFWIQEGTGSAQPVFYVDDVVLTGSVPITPPPPLAGMALYQDSYVSGWQNWSWATVNTGNTTPVNSGTSSIAVTSSAWSALSFHHDAMDTRPYATLTFWINGGATGGQVIKIVPSLGGTSQSGMLLPALAANTWQKVSIALSDLGIANKPNLTDLWFQEAQGLNQPTYYVDDVRLDFAATPSAVSVTIDNRRKIRDVDPRLFSANTAIWDGSFNTPTTAGLLSELNERGLRFPGGSASDEYHWQTNTSEGQTFHWATGFDAFAPIAQAARAQVFITVNYGTGTPDEAAAWVRYANVTKRYGFQYWEVGNENYGTWETDKNSRPHDPVTYATRFQQYVQQMKAVDRSIKVGVVIVTGEDSYANYADESATNPRTGATHHGWAPVMLATLHRLGCTPDFVVYHRYEQYSGGENDTFLLTAAQTWPADAANLRQMLNDYLGRDARDVEIDCTENNSVSSGPGKQTTSLVNGLYFADSLGNVMQTEFNSLVWWDFRNGVDGGNNNSPLLYGWRKYGDYGIVNANTPAAPADRYPTFYVAKLLKNFARGGEKVISATSDFWGVGAYATRGRDGTLRVLLINKHPTASLSPTIALKGVDSVKQATVFQYGIPQDNAAQTGTSSADVQQSSATLSGPTFTWPLAPYSATVLVIPIDSEEGD